VRVRLSCLFVGFLAHVIYTGPIVSYRIVPYLSVYFSRNSWQWRASDFYF